MTAFRALFSSLLVLGVLAVPAQAAQSIDSFEVETTSTSAGSHPDLVTRFSLEESDEVAENVEVNLPEGVFGNPNAVPTCNLAAFAQFECPLTAQVGTVAVRADYSGDPNFLLGTAPIYTLNVQPEGETARFGFVAPTLNVPVAIPIEVRTASDYGLRMTVQGITQLMPLSEARIEIWGFPASDDHSETRFLKGSPGNPPACPGSLSAICASQGGQAPHNTGLYPEPLTDNPSICTGKPLTVSIAVRTYQDPTNPTTAGDDYPPTTDCNLQKFDPVLNVGLTTGEADAPSGLELQLKAPQALSKAATPSNIRSATVVLPEGLTINPDAADGQTSCSDAQANLHSEGPARCPDNSKIGNFDIRTAALVAPLTGSLYFAEPKPGNQYRVLMVASGFGMNAKIIADVQPDPSTGRLTMSVTDLPQVPFEEFNLHLFASQRGLMATPTHCRIYQLESQFTPWNSLLSPQSSRPVFSIDSGPNGKPCPPQVRPFNPRLVAGSSNPVAGSFSSFHLRLDRDDGDQFLGDLNFRMPPGFTGYLRGISYCPEASIVAASQNLGRSEHASPSCPGSSQIGTTNVAAGPGTHPFNAIGRMYLAGPLEGAPLSLAAITPALAGPYDYGVVVVRVALHVDPLTAQVSAVSERVPSIIGGVPIRMRSIQVNIDRPNFTINPTNCANFTVDSQGIGDQGTITDFTSPFHAVNCASLPFRPTMRITQLGKLKQTKRSRNPRIRFDLRTRRGDANIRSLQVTLPKAFAIDQRHLANICSKAELQATRCAGRQPIGNAFADTPLLDEPLRGPAYAVSGFGKLPRVAFILSGQVTVIPQAESSSVRGRLRTVVPIVPDAPIGHFRLTLLGGAKGYLVNTRDLCVGRPSVGIAYVGQNGKRREQQVRLKTPCRRVKRAKRSNHR